MHCKFREFLTFTRIYNSEFDNFMHIFAHSYQKYDHFTIEILNNIQYIISAENQYFPLTDPIFQRKILIFRTYYLLNIVQGFNCRMIVFSVTMVKNMHEMITF